MFQVPSVAAILKRDHMCVVEGAVHALDCFKRAVEWLLWPTLFASDSTGTAAAGAQLRSHVFVTVDTDTTSSWKIESSACADSITYIGAYQTDFLREHFCFKFPHTSYICYFNFEAFVHAVYEDATLYSICQPLWCTLFDVALSVGTTEAVAESAYSSLGHHIKAGDQQNAVAADQLVVDWATPPSVLAMPQFILRIAEQLHSNMKAVTTTTAHKSKVVQRLASENGRGLL